MRTGRCFHRRWFRCQWRRCRLFQTNWTGFFSTFAKNPGSYSGPESFRIGMKWLGGGRKFASYPRFLPFGRYIVDSFTLFRFTDGFRGNLVWNVDGIGRFWRCCKWCLDLWWFVYQRLRGVFWFQPPRWFCHLKLPMKIRPRP